MHKAYSFFAGTLTASLLLLMTACESTSVVEPTPRPAPSGKDFQCQDSAGGWRCQDQTGLAYQTPAPAKLPALPPGVVPEPVHEGFGSEADLARAEQAAARDAATGAEQQEQHPTESLAEPAREPDVEASNTVGAAAVAEPAGAVVYAIVDDAAVATTELTPDNSATTSASVTAEPVPPLNPTEYRNENTVVITDTATDTEADTDARAGSTQPTPATAAADPAPAIATASEQPIGSYPKHYFALQLAATQNKAHLENYLLANPAINGLIVGIDRAGEQLFVLIAGIYPDYASAKAAEELLQLPPDQPAWIRTMGSLQAVLASP